MANRFRLIERDTDRQTDVLRLDDDTFIVRTPNATVCVTVTTDRDGHSLTYVALTPDDPYYAIDLTSNIGSRSICTRHPDARSE